MTDYLALIPFEKYFNSQTLTLIGFSNSLI